MVVDAQGQMDLENSVVTKKFLSVFNECSQLHGISLKTNSLGDVLQKLGYYWAMVSPENLEAETKEIIGFCAGLTAKNQNVRAVLEVAGGNENTIYEC